MSIVISASRQTEKYGLIWYYLRIPEDDSLYSYWVAREADATCFPSEEMAKYAWRNIITEQKRQIVMDTEKQNIDTDTIGVRKKVFKLIERLEL